jgi:hypothetical protein
MHDFWNEISAPVGAVSTEIQETLTLVTLLQSEMILGIRLARELAPSAFNEVCEGLESDQTIRQYVPRCDRRSQYSRIGMLVQKRTQLRKSWA